MKGMPRTPLNLKSSLCTDNPTGSDTYDFNNEPTQVVENTGMERNGGITAVYEQETTFNTAGLQSLITKSGDLLQVDSSYNVRINDNAIGNVGGVAVTLRNALKGYQDAAWSSTNTIIGIRKIGSRIYVDEINPSTLAVLNTRYTTFTLPNVVFTNVSLIKYMAMAYADSLQFILSNNFATYVASESSSTVGAIGSLTSVSGTSIDARVWTSVCWSPALSIFVAVTSDVGAANQVMYSQDGITWSAASAPSARQWQYVCWSPELGMFVAVANSGVAAGQIMYSTTGSGTWTAATAPSAQQWASVCWSPALGMFVATAINGLVSQQIMYSTTGSGTWTAATSPSAQQWASVCWSPELAKFVAVASSGLVSEQIMYSATGSGTWTAATSPNAQAWNQVCWSPALGMFVAVASNGLVAQQIMYSTTGTGTWTAATSPSAQIWYGVCWSPELGMFVAVASDGAVGVQIMYSTDGISWKLASSPSAQQWSDVCWSPALGAFVAVSINGAVGVQVMKITPVINGSNLGWKFSANRYIVGNQGVGQFSIGDVAATMTAIATADATWCVIDQFSGTSYSRAILTYPVKKNAANNITGISEVGYNQAGTWNATPTQYGYPIGGATITIGTRAEGPGYSEATMTNSGGGTNIYSYIAPPMQKSAPVQYLYFQSQTQTPAIGYGRFNDFSGNTRGSTCSLRSVMAPNGTTSAIPSFISAAINGAYSDDCLGVPITNVGEYDETFMPHVVDNGSTRLNCIYRYNGVLFFFVIQTASTNTIQKISDDIYMVNTLSPINAISVSNRTLNLGSNDYNGRIYFKSAAAIITTTKFAATMHSYYANSVDAGERLITQTFSASVSQVPGIGLPSFIDRAISQYGVDIYSASNYAITYQAFNVTYTNPFQSGTLYVADTRIPLAMGYNFSGRVMQTEIETVFLGVGAVGAADIDYDYLCYEIGNDTLGIYQAFYLYGQTYLFDGNGIWLSTFTGSLYSGKGRNPVAIATGLTLMGSSPTEIYFLSTQDYSIFSFTGGQSLTKSKRMNDIRNSSGGIETLMDGVYNVRDNSLLIQTLNNWVWIRDGIVTEMFKKSTQTSIHMYDTQDGIVICNTVKKWTYDFKTRGTTTTTGGTAVSTVVPLTWQSAYHSLKGNELSITHNWIITIYSPEGRITMPVTLRCHAFDQDKYTLQREDLTIAPQDWDDLSFVRLRIQPKNRKALASSVQIDTTVHIVITDVSVEYGDETQAPIAAARSK